jgi:hypothetical protein
VVPIMNFLIEGLLLTRKVLGQGFQVDRNHKLWNNGDIYNIGDIYSICKYYWNVATCKWKIHNEKSEINSFVVKFRS